MHWHLSEKVFWRKKAWGNNGHRLANMKCYNLGLEAHKGKKYTERYIFQSEVKNISFFLKIVFYYFQELYVWKIFMMPVASVLFNFEKKMSSSASFYCSNLSMKYIVMLLNNGFVCRVDFDFQSKFYMLTLLNDFRIIHWLLKDNVHNCTNVSLKVI